MSQQISSMSFEEALKELEEILGKIDNGEEKLDSAVAAFERATQLRQHCEKKLTAAKLKIEKIVKKPDGKVELKDISETKT